MSAIEVTCPGCGVTLGVPENAVGKRGRCAVCARSFVIPHPAASSSPDAVAPEDTIIGWLVDEPEEATVQADSAPNRSESPRHFAVRLARVDASGAQFCFHPEVLYDEDFRASLPRQCVVCGSRTGLVVHLVTWSRTTGEGPRVDLPYAPASSVLELDDFPDLYGRQLLARLPMVQGVSEPYSLPFPYYVCQYCSPVGAMVANVRPGTRRRNEECELQIPSLLQAEMFAAAIRGPDDPARHEIRKVRKGQEGDPWQRLPKFTRVRIERWFQLEESEKFIAYFPDADYSQAEVGLAGVAVTDQRLVFHKNVRLTTIALRDISGVALARSGARVTVDILPAQGKPIRLRALPADAGELQQLLNDLMGQARGE